MLLVHLFVCFARICFCPFSLSLGVEGWLRFVIVAYPGPFYKLFSALKKLGMVGRHYDFILLKYTRQKKKPIQ